MQHWNLFLYLTSLIPKLTHKKLRLAFGSTCNLITVITLEEEQAWEWD